MAIPDNATPFNSAEYDKAVRQTVPYYEVIHSETVDLVKTIKPEVNCWLDTGCGTSYLVEIALSYFLGTNFILTDPAEAMLKLAVNRLKGRQEQRIKYLPPTPSERLNIFKNEIHPQVITAILCHHSLQKPQHYEATRVCYQLLEKDGFFVTVENITPATRDGITIGMERWKRFQMEHGRSNSVVEEHARRFNSAYFQISIEEHLNLLQKAGFKSAALFWLSHMQAGFYAIK